MDVGAPRGREHQPHPRQALRAAKVKAPPDIESGGALMRTRSSMLYPAGSISEGSVASAVRELLTLWSTTCSRMVAAPL